MISQNSYYHLYFIHCNIIAVLLATFPFQAMVLPMLLSSLKGYLAHNDVRNKVTNETLQGMRVVKLRFALIY